VTSSERRNGPDRRRTPRGGRRLGDADGYAPLVLVADANAGSAAQCETILARLKFAVAPAGSVDEAIRVMRALRPELVIARLTDVKRLQEEMRRDPLTANIPVIVGDAEDPDALVESIRAALRTRQPR
jgi:hypothetical protein